MNHLSRLIICLCILLTIIGYQIIKEFEVEPFDSNPLDTVVKTDSDASDASDANMNYTSLLLFLKKNPDKSVKFITDIKKKFFDESCTVKNINFDTITQLNGNTF